MHLINLFQCVIDQEEETSQGVLMDKQIKFLEVKAEKCRRCGGETSRNTEKEKARGKSERVSECRPGLCFKSSITELNPTSRKPSLTAMLPPMLLQLCYSLLRFIQKF